MHNIWLIARREYMERIRAKSFLVMTVLIPLLMGGLIGGAALLNSRGKAGTHMAVATTDRKFGEDFKSVLAKDMTVDVISPPDAQTRTQLDARNKGKDFDGYLWVNSATATAAATYEWIPKSTADIITKSIVAGAIRSTLTRERLAIGGMASADVESLMKPIDLDSAAKGKNDSSIAAVASAYGLFFLMYFVILFYGMNVARSIIEEKTSRIFEVLLSTIRPEEMMAGKVLGVGAVGLTQVAIWLVAALALTTTGLLSSGVHLHFTAVQMVAFVVFFVLGYVLYSGVAAALGAMSGSEQELQQMNMFLMLPLIACSMVIFRVITDSDGTIAKAFSFFPFCTPLIMYVRIAVHQPPLWQIALSVFDLVLTILVVLWFASRIYRVGILMYGKKPNLPEIMRWLKYS